MIETSKPWKCRIRMCDKFEDVKLYEVDVPKGARSVERVRVLVRRCVDCGRKIRKMGWKN